MIEHSDPVEQFGYEIQNERWAIQRQDKGLEMDERVIKAEGVTISEDPETIHLPNVNLRALIGSQNEATRQNVPVTSSRAEWLIENQHGGKDSHGSFYEIRFAS